MTRRFASIALLAALISVWLNAGAVSVSIALSVNPDGTFDTTYPNGTKPIGGSSCSTLTCDDIGDAVADINEDSATQFTISTSGTSDSSRDIGLAYTNISSGNDIQVKARVPAVSSWTGPVENFSQFGIGISESIAQTGYFAHCMSPGIEPARFKWGDTVGGISAAIAGAGATTPEYLLLTYDVSATDIECFHSNDDITYTQIGATVDKTLDCSSSCQGYVYGTSHNSNTVTATLTDISIGTTIDTSGSPPGSTPRQGISFFADWETQEIQPRSDLHDGGFAIGMAPPLDGTCTPINTTGGGVGEFSGTDYMRVMDEAGTGIAAVDGSYFLRFLLNKNCDYNAINDGGVIGDINGAKDKARTEFHTSGLKEGKSAEQLPFDEYVWIGFAMYWPSSLEVETGANQRMPIFEIANNNSAITMRVEENYGLTLATQFSTTSTSLPLPEAGNIIWTDDISNYFDQWTSVILRVRMNPFTGAGPHSTSGISGSTGDSYVGDRGSVEMWLDNVKVIDSQAPLGSVPSTLGWWTVHEIYKGGWKKRTTSVTGPVVYYMDGPWIGEATAGAGYEDVSPTQTTCTDDCP